MRSSTLSGTSTSRSSHKKPKEHAEVSMQQNTCIHIYTCKYASIHIHDTHNVHNHVHHIHDIRRIRDIHHIHSVHNIQKYTILYMNIHNSECVLQALI